MRGSAFEFPERFGATEIAMTALFDGTEGNEDIGEILNRMKANCPRPSSTSTKLWQLRRATAISSHSRNRETMPEKAVAMLASNGHMPGWYNQCPAASGIGGSSRGKGNRVDLVRWSAADRELSLVELKWDSNTPTQAVQQVLRYGAAYLFCLMHRNRLRLERCRAISARHVSLLIAAPAHYYADDDLRGCLERARESFKPFDMDRDVSWPSISLDALAFPAWFDRVPFFSGADVQEYCNGRRLTDAGREVLDAFEGLTPARPGRKRRSG